MAADNLNPWETEASVALFMAILYHGLSSLAATAVPARADTVLSTADKFLDYLDGREDHRVGRR